MQVKHITAFTVVLAECTVARAAGRVPDRTDRAVLLNAQASALIEVPVEQCVDAQLRFAFEAASVAVPHG